MWHFENKEFHPDMIGDNVGFTYVITDLENGKRYFGKKLFVTTRKLPPLKGAKRRRTKIIETDWRDYWSSSDLIKSLVVEHGPIRFKREILTLCKSRGQMSYEELKLQVTNEVLMKPDQFYNQFIGCRIHAKHVRKIEKH